jgi:hypothetical protein
LLPLGRYRAFGLNIALMVASTNLASQPPDISSIQSLLLYSMKLENPNNLLHLFNDSFEGELPNVTLPIPVANTPISDSKCSELSKSLFVILFGSFGHSNFSCPPFHPNT